MSTQLIKALKQGFKSSLLSPPTKEQNRSSLGDLWARIPEDLLTDDLRKAGHTSLVLSGEDVGRYYSTYDLLREEPGLEYLSDKELKDQLWRLECEVFINREEYKRELRNLNKKIEDFIASLIRPFEPYEVLIPIDYFKVGDHVIQLGDCLIRHFTEEQLLNWGFGEHEIWRDSLEFFADKTSIVIRQTGNNLEAVIHRARRRAELVVHALRIAFSDRDFTPDLQLKFHLSSHTVIREADKPKIRRGRHTSLGPWQLEYFEKHDEILAAYANDILMRSVALKSEFKPRIDRAIHWLGNAIEQEDYDQRVAQICTALESLLCSKSENRKGEPIAYRMALLATLTGDGFMHPADVLWVYKLRSTVVHGSDIEVVGEAEYHRILNAARRALKSYIELIQTNDLKNYKALIQHLESSPEAKELLKWLDDHVDTEEIVDLRTSLRQAVNEEILK